MTVKDLTKRRIFNLRSFGMYGSGFYFNISQSCLVFGRNSTKCLYKWFQWLCTLMSGETWRELLAEAHFAFIIREEAYSRLPFAKKRTKREKVWGWGWGGGNEGNMARTGINTVKPLRNGHLRTKVSGRCES